MQEAEGKKRMLTGMQDLDPTQSSQKLDPSRV